MSPEAFKHTLNREEFTKINVDNLEASKHMLEVCFGKDTNLRKELLLDTDSTGFGDGEEIPTHKTKKSSAKVAKSTAKAKPAKKAIKKKK